MKKQLAYWLRATDRGHDYFGPCKKCGCKPQMVYKVNFYERITWTDEEKIEMLEKCNEVVKDFWSSNTELQNFFGCKQCCDEIIKSKSKNSPNLVELDNNPYLKTA